MAKDLKLDPTTWDLVVENGDFVIIDGLEQIVQAIGIACRFFFAEWYLDETMGVRHYEDILIKNPNLPEVDTLLKSAILGVDGVNEIIEFNSGYNNVTRVYSASFRCDTVEGVTDTITV